MSIDKKQLPVVVAIDGSNESASALAWAAVHARDRGLPLRVVTAYAPPDINSYSLSSHTDEWDMASRGARRRAEQVIDEVLGHADVDHIVALGPIERVLEDYSHNAALIVIGTRATRGWLGRLRSSLTNRLTGSVACPVVSVSGDTVSDGDERFVAA